MTTPQAGSGRDEMARQAWATARGFDLLAPHWDELNPVMQKAVTDAVAYAALLTPAPAPPPPEEREAVGEWCPKCGAHKTAWASHPPRATPASAPEECRSCDGHGGRDLEDGQENIVGWDRCTDCLGTGRDLGPVKDCANCVEQGRPCHTHWRAIAELLQTPGPDLFAPRATPASEGSEDAKRLDWLDAEMVRRDTVESLAEAEMDGVTPEAHLYLAWTRPEQTLRDAIDAARTAALRAGGQR